MPPLTVIEDNVFIGPGVVFTNDSYPPSKRLIGTRVKNGAVIAAGTTLAPGIVVAENSVIGFGFYVFFCSTWHRGPDVGLVGSESRENSLPLLSTIRMRGLHRLCELHI
ncbi:MAG: hypothetical protein NWE89_16690 [Candidatus Bathyarchaeota archaeon]|nr:hypothetical protein [Candidatus Bathyarchaeota archaeon]